MADLVIKPLFLILGRKQSNNYFYLHPDFLLTDVYRIKCVFVPSNGIDQFSAEMVESYETALLKAREEGTNVRALLLCNPHNPLGRCYPLETIKALMRLCQKYRLHLLSDEVYALSVFDNSDPAAVQFTSVLSFDSTPYISPNYLHVVYGFSKDFAAGGLRLGCIYSRNTALMDTISAITQFSWSGPLNQLFAAEMLEHTEWLDAFFTKSRQVLKERNEKCRAIFGAYGIEYSHGANAGFFIWVCSLHVPCILVTIFLSQPKH